MLMGVALSNSGLLASRRLCGREAWTWDDGLSTVSSHCPCPHIDILDQLTNFNTAFLEIKSSDAVPTTLALCYWAYHLNLQSGHILQHHGGNENM